MRRGWINLQAELLQRLPSSVRAVLGAGRHLPTYLQWLVHPRGRSRLIELTGSLHGSFSGCRCIVMGNGPSLKEMDLNRLAKEYTFGLNRISLMTEELGFGPTFLAAINRYVLEQFSKEIRELDCLKFLNWSYRGPFLGEPNTVFVETGPNLDPTGDLRRGYYAGAGTVTVFALEAAYYLGFSEVVLIGVDHSYHSEGTPNRAVVAQTEDRSHFSKDYFGPGVIWQLPDLAAMERGYRKIRELYSQGERLIVDATLGGKLEVFPKVSLHSHLDGSRFESMADHES